MRKVCSATKVTRRRSRRSWLLGLEVPATYAMFYENRVRYSKDFMNIVKGNKSTDVVAPKLAF